MVSSAALPSPIYDITLPTVPFNDIRDSIHTAHQSFTLTQPMQHHDLETFHPFPRLSVELRYRLWDLIVDLTHPRFLPLEPTTCDVPLSLQICRESRTETKRRYQLLKSKVGGKMTVDFRFWVDYDKDILCINRNLDLFDTAKDRYDHPTPICGASCIFRDWLEPVKILAIDVSMLLSVRPHKDYPRFFKSLNELCPNLKELHVIASRPWTTIGPVVRMTEESYKPFETGDPRAPGLSQEDQVVSRMWVVLQMELWTAQEDKGHCKALRVKWKEVDLAAGLLAL